MPRTARASVGNLCYHVMNRGNLGAAVFEKPDDYEAFVQVIGKACERTPLRVLAYCLMPNHFHLALWPYEDGDLSRWMQWLLTCHVRRYHRHHESSGRIWQGRFKAFPAQQDEHLLTVLRYIERNPLRAGLVQKAEDWPWSSLRGKARKEKDRPAFLTDPPIARPKNWVGYVNRPTGHEQADIDHLRTCIARGRPFGNEAWIRQTAGKLGLEASLRPRGRPLKRPAPAKK